MRRGPSAERRRTHTVTLLLVVVLAVAAAFAFMHTGARGRALCRDNGFSGTASLSLWPPGARCSGGEPEISRVELDPSFALALPAVALLVFGGAALLGGAGRSRRLR
jgi:hypothetical protein